jgi:predicted aconitase with swiveling domain
LDSLLVSGVVLSEVWFSRRIPVVEYPGADIFDRIASGDIVEVEGTTGAIAVRRGPGRRSFQKISFD